MLEVNEAEEIQGPQNKESSLESYGGDIDKAMLEVNRLSATKIKTTIIK